MAIGIAGYVERTAVIASGATWETFFPLRQDGALGKVRRGTIFDGFVHAEGLGVTYDLSVADSLAGTWRIFLTGSSGPSLATAAGTPIQGERIPGLFLRFRVIAGVGTMTGFHGYGLVGVL